MKTTKRVKAKVHQVTVESLWKRIKRLDQQVGDLSIAVQAWKVAFERLENKMVTQFTDLLAKISELQSQHNLVAEQLNALQIKVRVIGQGEDSSHTKLSQGPELDEIATEITSASKEQSLKE